MSQATSAMRDFAERLIVYETRGTKAAGTEAAAAFHVFQKLRPQLVTLMGHAGFNSLLSRALALASAEVRSLRSVQVKADGSLDGLEELQAQVDPRKVFECGVVLLAQILGLLVTFIGESLTLQLMGEIWPKVVGNELNFGKGGNIENTK